MLTAYTQTVVRLMLNDQSFNKVNTYDLHDWINVARNQVAGESECVRAQASLATTSGGQVYPFSALAITGQGYQQVIAVRMAFIGSEMLDFRPFEWFAAFYWNSGSSGSPLRMAQQGQGADGTLYFDPVPNAVFAISLDVAALPIPLVDDATPEVIPPLWTDAISYYASYMGFLQQGDAGAADGMFSRYQAFMARARAASTSPVLPITQPTDQRKPAPPTDVRGTA
jgi:hypothetical protein